MKVYKANWHDIRMKEYPTAKFILTGEFREPLKGDWYLSGAIPEAYRAKNDLSTKFHILRRIS